MSDRRQHRGKHPEDQRLFAPEAIPRLRAATDDLSWLMSRNYATPSALKVVGDHYELDARQRIAVMRCACSDQAKTARRAREASEDEVRGSDLLIDGYNVLTTVEAALAGGVLLGARDGCLRDMASMHGSYRKVQETIPALRLIGQALVDLGAGACRWLLDSPVSNSGRLKTVIRQIAEESGHAWTIDVVMSPDKLLCESRQIVATADSAVLDRCFRWFNLARQIVAHRVSAAEIVELG